MKWNAVDWQSLLVNRRPVNCGGWDLSLTGKHGEVRRSGGTLLLDIAPLFPITLEILSRDQLRLSCGRSWSMEVVAQLALATVGVEDIWDVLGDIVEHDDFVEEFLMAGRAASGSLNGAECGTGLISSLKRGSKKLDIPLDQLD